MHDELNAFAGCHTELKQVPCLVGADQHDQVVEALHSDRVAIGVQHVVVVDPVLAGGRHDHGIHTINLA